MATIKELREQTYLSQSKFAQIVNIPTANIAKWEQGVSKPPEYVVNLVEFYLRQHNLIK